MLTGIQKIYLKDLTNYLSNSKGGGDVIIYNNTSAQVSAEQRDGKTYVTIDEVKRLLHSEVKNSNSVFSKDMQQEYELKRRR